MDAAAARSGGTARASRRRRRLRGIGRGEGDRSGAAPGVCAVQRRAHRRAVRRRPARQGRPDGGSGRRAGAAARPLRQATRPEPNHLFTHRDPRPAAGRARGGGMVQGRYDLIVIGSGSSGSFAAREAASAYGKRIAVVEKHRWGGDCMTVACKPTKTYLMSAELYHQIRALGPELGVLADGVRLDFRQIKARKDGFVAASSGEARRRNLREHGIDLFDGAARFLDSRTIAVGEQRLQADNILPALGSLPAQPPIDGLSDVGALTNETVLDLDEVPQSLLVIGAGAVGVEFAQMLARFGARVTVVELAPRILPRMDADVAAALHEALAEEDIEILTGSSVERVEPSERGVRAVIATPDGRREV